MPQVVVSQIGQCNSVWKVGFDSWHPIVLLAIFGDIQMVILKSASIVSPPFLAILTLLNHGQHSLLAQQILIYINF